jgi:glucan-binding YG repeat protein
MEEIKEKKCFKCEKTLVISEFYTHLKMRDGHLNKCKKCTKIEVRKREIELKKNPDWVEKEKKRARDKYYRLEYKGKHKSTPERKREIIKKYNQKFPEKALARKYTEIYLTKNPGYNLHHWSYNQEDWLDVIELPIKEHHFFHRFIKYDQERMMYRGLDGILLDDRKSHTEYLEFCKKNYEY